MRCFFAVAMVTAMVLGGSRSAGAQAFWPQFRGPGGSGVGMNGDFPVHFGPNSNVVWKTALPSGHSSPCIWGDRIFLTGFAENQLETLCLDRQDGRILWRQRVEPAKLERGAQWSSPANATAATDGRRVYVYFGCFGLLCYDFAGQEQWRKPLPVPVTQHGAGTSPVLAGDKLLLACDQDVGAYLLAVDMRTGETAWRADRSQARRGFTTPLAWPEDQPELVLVAGTLRLTAYQVSDGVERWSVSGLANEMVASPIAGGGLVYVAGWTPGSTAGKLPLFDTVLAQGDKNQDGQLGREEAASGPAASQFIYIDADKDGRITRQEWESMASIFERSQNACLAVRPDGRGDVTASHVVWKQGRGLPYVPTPLYYEGRLYLVKNGGLASCFEARTGKVLYLEERLGAIGDYYASPVAAAGKICAASQSGLVLVYRAGDTLEVLARNQLGEPVLATPALAEKTLYVRTKEWLYAFGERPGDY